MTYAVKTKDQKYALFSKTIHHQPTFIVHYKAVYYHCILSVWNNVDIFKTICIVKFYFNHYMAITI